MEPTLLATAATAALCGMILAVSSLRFRLPRPRLLGVAVVAMAVWRLTPAGAVVPPPGVRIVEREREPEPEPEREAIVSGASHTVVAGECLWRIAASVLAERHGRPPTSAEIAGFWPRIYEANRAVIGDDPDLILVGQVLDIPEDER